jgi:DNA-binding response OmpR family regulator
VSEVAQLSAHLLLMEDDVAVADLVQAALEKQMPAVTVDWAKDGQEAKKLLNQGNYDLIVTDIMVRGFNGFELIQHILKQGSRTPIFVITGAYPNGFDQYAKALGIVGYFEKPFSVEKLTEDVKTTLKDRLCG